jgi:hypothetical protein
MTGSLFAGGPSKKMTRCPPIYHTQFPLETRVSLTIKTCNVSKELGLDVVSCDPGWLNLGPPLATYWLKNLCRVGPTSSSTPVITTSLNPFHKCLLHHVGQTTCKCSISVYCTRSDDSVCTETTSCTDNRGVNGQPAKKFGRHTRYMLCC